MLVLQLPNYYVLNVRPSTPKDRTSASIPNMRLSTLLAFVSAALSAPVGQQGEETEDVWFVGGHMGLARDSETFVVGISFTLEPSMALCTASNFTMPSSTFKCGDSDYSFSLTKVPEMYSRYTVHISRTFKSG